MSELSNEMRFVNSGINVLTKKLGNVSVRELCLEDIQKLSKELLTLILMIKAEENLDDSAFIGQLISSPQLIVVLKSLFSASTGLPVDSFNSLPVSDTLKLAKAFFETNDLGELKDVFLAFLKIFGESLKSGQEQNPNN